MKFLAALTIAFALAFSGVHFCDHAMADETAVAGGSGEMAMHPAMLEDCGQKAPNAPAPDCNFGPHCKACPSGAALVAFIDPSGMPAEAASVEPTQSLSLSGVTRTPDPPPPRAG